MTYLLRGNDLVAIWRDDVLVADGLTMNQVQAFFEVIADGGSEHEALLEIRELGIVA